MMYTMPVQNCLHFLMPVTLSDWSAYQVPGIVGVLRKRASGQYEVIDAFSVDSVPSARELATSERYMHWAEAAGGHDHLRFDVFLMPLSDTVRRQTLLTLIQRSCGFSLPTPATYAANAA
jgi:hypothetical protein